MQRQKEQEPSLRQEASADRQQQQKQKKKDKQKQHNQDNKNPVEQPTADPEIDDLNAEMAAIVHAVEQTYGSVQGMMTQKSISGSAQLAVGLQKFVKLIGAE